MSETSPFWVFQPCADYMYDLSAAFDADLVGDNDEIEELVVEFMTENQVPGCAVGVTDGEDVLYLKTFGAQHLGPRKVRRPAEDLPGGSLLPPEQWRINTPSAIGSVSKVVTAVSALRLVQQGLLDLDQRLIDSYWFPGFFQAMVPSSWWNIRMRDLLTHASGLPSMPTGGIATETALRQFWATLMPIPLSPPLVAQHPGEWLRRTLPVLWGTHPQPFAEGAEAKYSNTGYAIIGAAIDSLTAIAQSLPAHERGYENYTAHLLQREGMLTPCLESHWRSIPGRATGYTVVNDRFKRSQLPALPTDHYGTRWYAAPGGWLMTIGDLTRLIISVENLPSQLRDEMFSSPRREPSLGRVGMGVILKQGGQWYHGGDFYGYAARIQLWPGTSTIAGPPTTGVAVLCNRNGSGFNSNALESLMENIRDVVIGAHPGGLGRVDTGSAVSDLVQRYGDLRARSLATQVVRAHVEMRGDQSPAEWRTPRSLELASAIDTRDGNRIVEAVAEMLDEVEAVEPARVAHDDEGFGPL